MDFQFDWSDFAEFNPVPVWIGGENLMGTVGAMLANELRRFGFEPGLDGFDVCDADSKVSSPVV